jgi:hypothetical protein
MEIERLVSILVAMLLGGLVGLEREVAGKPAGLRTNMLVAGAAAFIVRLSDLLVDRFVADVAPAALVRVLRNLVNRSPSSRASLRSTSSRAMASMRDVRMKDLRELDRYLAILRPVISCGGCR